jgi:hypothetical protein
MLYAGSLTPARILRVKAPCEKEDSTSRLLKLRSALASPFRSTGDCIDMTSPDRLPMPQRSGLISRDEQQRIETGLRAIEKDIESGKFDWDRSLEDVHRNIEVALTKRIGSAGGKLHTARSRNDQRSKVSNATRGAFVIAWFEQIFFHLGLADSLDRQSFSIANSSLANLVFRV